MPHFDAPDRKLLLLLTAFSVFDVAIVLPLLKGKPLMMFCGGAAHIYGAVMTVLAVSVLTNRIFNDSSMPWMTLWRSTFITSFLNSFEILGICAFFILNAVKAGIAVKNRTRYFQYKIRGVCAARSFCCFCASYSVFGYFLCRRRAFGAVRTAGSRTFAVC